MEIIHNFSNTAIETIIASSENRTHTFLDTLRIIFICLWGWFCNRIKRLQVIHGSILKRFWILTAVLKSPWFSLGPWKVLVFFCGPWNVPWNLAICVPFIAFRINQMILLRQICALAATINNKRKISRYCSICTHLYHTYLLFNLLM